MSSPVIPYLPAMPPQDPALLARYLQEELQRIATTLRALDRNGAVNSFVAISGSGATSATAGAATALPATPAGYTEVIIDGQKALVPFYSP